MFSFFYDSDLILYSSIFGSGLLIEPEKVDESVVNAKCDDAPSRPISSPKSRLGSHKVLGYGLDLRACVLVLGQDEKDSYLLVLSRAEH